MVKKQRRKWGEFVKCYRCPNSHPGWKRGALRMRRHMPYCPEHLIEYDRRHKPWPRCPNCGENEFGFMKWGGSVEKTFALCTECNFKALALDHFDYHTIKMIASPVGRV